MIMRQSENANSTAPAMLLNNHWSRIARTFAAYFLAAVLLVTPGFAADVRNQKEQDRIRAAAQVLKEVLSVPGNIPQELLDGADCIVILPGVRKGVLGVRGSYGRGIIVCRTGNQFSAEWGAPALYEMEGSSTSLESRGQAEDFFLLLMRPRAAESLLAGEVKLGEIKPENKPGSRKSDKGNPGADFSVAAGPKGISAGSATAVVKNAAVLSYSRNKELFAGVSLEGSRLRPDSVGNARLYGKRMTTTAIVLEGKAAIPPSARELVALLNSKSPTHRMVSSLP